MKLCRKKINRKLGYHIFTTFSFCLLILIFAVFSSPDLIASCKRCSHSYQLLQLCHKGKIIACIQEASSSINNISDYQLSFEDSPFFEKDIDDEITEHRRCLNLKIVDGESKGNHLYFSITTPQNVQKIGSTSCLSSVISDTCSVMLC